MQKLEFVEKQFTRQELVIAQMERKKEQYGSEGFTVTNNEMLYKTAEEIIDNLLNKVSECQE